MKPYENSISQVYEEDPSCALLRKRMRKSLLDVGKSPDAHVYDFDLSFLKHHPSSSSRFLIKLWRFYDRLDSLKKRILLSECLEVGRIYPFWYYGWMSDTRFRKERKQVISSFKEAFA